MQQYDKKARPYIPGYKVGDLVWLRDPTSQGLPRRFQSLYKGPLEIVEVIGTHTVRLKNLDTGRLLRNTTHVNALKLYRGSYDSSNEQISPAVTHQPSATPTDNVRIGEDNVYEARKILRHKLSKGKTFYLVDWKPINDIEQDPTWEPRENCNKALLDEYNTRNK